MKRLLVLFTLFALSVSCISAQSDEMDCEDGFRLIEHAFGETCVVENPQRVVPLDMMITELLLIAGVEPVAVSGTVLDAYTQMHPELEDTFSDLIETAQDTGFPSNVEAILNSRCACDRPGVRWSV